MRFQRFSPTATVACFLAATALSADARAITLPDVSSTCPTGVATCFKIDTGGGTSTAIVARALGNGIGLQGEGATGVRGISTAGQGVWGTGPMGGLFEATQSGVGVFATSSTGSGTGVYGSVSGTGTGVVGASTGGGVGVKGFVNSASSGSIGVWGQAASGATAMRAQASGAAMGLWASTGANGRAIFAQSSGTGYGIYAENFGSGYAVFGANDTGGWAGYFYGDLEVEGYPFSTTQATFTVQSDARLKNNVEPMRGALDRLLQLRGVTFEWKDPAQHGGQTGPQRGFIAQEVERVMPEWVSVDRHGWKNVTTRGFEAMVVESLRTLSAENEALRAHVKALEAGRRVTAAGFPGGDLGTGLALGLAPLGLVVALRRRASR